MKKMGQTIEDNQIIKSNNQVDIVIFTRLHPVNGVTIVILDMKKHQNVTKDQIV